MEQHKLVLPEHLNHYGYLFGGDMLKWVDEYSWIAATLDYPGCKFVTIGMDEVAFRKPVRKGAVLRFSINKEKQGASSVVYAVEVFADKLEDNTEERVFSTRVTFVCLDDEGNKRALIDA